MKWYHGNSRSQSHLRNKQDRHSKEGWLPIWRSTIVFGRAWKQGHRLELVYYWDPETAQVRCQTLKTSKHLSLVEPTTTKRQNNDATGRRRANKPSHHLGTFLFCFLGLALLKCETTLEVDWYSCSTRAWSLLLWCCSYYRFVWFFSLQHIPTAGRHKLTSTVTLNWPGIQTMDEACWNGSQRRIVRAAIDLRVNWKKRRACANVIVKSDNSSVQEQWGELLWIVVNERLSADEDWDFVFVERDAVKELVRELATAVDEPSEHYE